MFVYNFKTEQGTIGIIAKSLAEARNLMSDMKALMGWTTTTYDGMANYTVTITERK